MSPLQEMCADVGIVESLLGMFFGWKGSTTEADMLSEHIDGLYSYALALSCNRVDAEDLVEETYVRAIPAAGRLREESNVKSWMFTILRNIWLDQLRQRADIDQILPVRGSSAKNPHSLLLTSLDQDQVRQAISKLPVESREIILLR